MTISISPASNELGLTGGLLAIRITAATSSGVPITRFEIPLAINLGRIHFGSVPMLSESGVGWIPIQLLTSSTLPASSAEGYYINQDGEIVVLTRHLTYFGFKKYQKKLEVRPRSPLIETGMSTRLFAIGGSGKGIRGFNTSTPSICKVTSGGLLIGLTSGVCIFRTTKAGDTFYASEQSAENHVAVQMASQRKLSLALRALSIAVAQKTSPMVIGGSGKGVVTLETSTPSFCSISANGVVTGLQVGSCTIRVLKASDERYLSAASQSVSFAVTRKVSVKP